ncbi:MAG TPA: hypothetical protein VMR97_00490, partial [Acidimicrobiales bacterium]|nr:hypothetical protein [Acidimicrobiales bacterium]
MQRQLVVWCPGLLEQQEHGREARAFDRVVAAIGEISPRLEALRPGVCALCTRGPSRYFGGDQALADLVSRALTGVRGSEDETRDTQHGVVGGVGVADGLFAATLAARSSTRRPGRAPVLVAPGDTPGFLSTWPVEVLGRPELADLLCRLGIRTLGAFAALPARHVLARFGTDGSICQAVAAGEEGEPPGLRLLPPRSSGRAVDSGPPGASPPRAAARQTGFFGGSAGAEARAAKSVIAVQGLLHPEGVVRGRLQGGRGPAERARLVPWGEQGAGVGAYSPGPRTFPRKRPDTKGAVLDTQQGQTFPRKPSGVRRRPADAAPLAGGPPWPGQLPPPSPVVVLARALPAELLDLEGSSVGISNRAVASSAPARLSVAGGPWSEVEGWAGPWPSDERWWSKRGRSRQARMQVVTA